MAHDITKDVIGCKEFEVQEINISGEPALFLGSISLNNHLVNKAYVDTKILTTWLKTLGQTGLTGDKSGAFNLTTTKTITAQDITINNLLNFGGGSTIKSGILTGNWVLTGGNMETTGALSGGELFQTDGVEHGIYFANNVNKLTQGNIVWKEASRHFGVNEPNPLVTLHLTDNIAQPQIRMATTASTAPVLRADSGQTAANAKIFQFIGRWGVNVANFNAMSGDDTGNKDDGWWDWKTRVSGQGLRSVMSLMPDGDLVWNEDGAGLLFAEIYARDNTTTTSTSTTKTQILIFDTDGESNGIIPDHTNDHITITKAGKYKIDTSISIKNSSGSAHVISVEMYKNNGATVFNNIHAGRNLGTGSDVGNLTISGIVDVALNDTLELWITSDSGAARNVTVEDINFSAIMIGG